MKKTGNFFKVQPSKATVEPTRVRLKLIHTQNDFAMKPFF
jgi:hypothetical protein